MGKMENEAFLTMLGQLYNKTKKWGTVWLTIKRVFEEHHKYKHKREFRKLREEDRKKQSEDSTGKFDVIVRAKTTKKKISTLVKADEVGNFQSALSKIMKSHLLKNTAFIKEPKKEVHKKTHPLPQAEEMKDIEVSQPKKFKAKQFS
eukprot:TRINITY_DN5689_c0_g3_i1.p1 TRINITY_DN5689_c0_g3~~TRINITY_DN5689_c0_g3_i1.p1  ORF type:complete len:147 (+),score=29.95 TRINITY_DN5689_c0_g3_i1:188-628(+)